MHRTIIVFIVTVASAFGAHQILQSRPIAAVETPSEQTEPADPGPEIAIEKYTVQEGDTFTNAMKHIDVPYSEALEIVNAAEDIFDFTSIRLGKTFRLVYEDGEQTRLEYEPNKEDLVEVDLKNDFKTIIRDIPYKINPETAAVTIDESMYVSGIDAGLPETLILKVADVFAWEIDFATEVQSGDAMRVLYEERFRNGEKSGVGDVIAAEFVNNGETHHAYRYEYENGEISYFDEEGNSLVRKFLKAPLSYSRITSGFTYARFHPTLKRTTPHRAIDYAAPTGTPILAVADGTVQYSGWNGGFGRYIDIRHNSIYETQYAHLSRIAVHSGQRVKQGDVIGYVGSTGFSTGPHLHYQVEVSGTLVNPLKVEFPKGDPLPESERGRFEEQKQKADEVF